MAENVREIIKAYCKVHYPEADGLSTDDCGCSFDDLQPCYSFCMDCVPAKYCASKEEFKPIKKRKNKCVKIAK